LLALALIMLTAVPATVRAEWREASSANFLVYGDQSASQIRDFTDMLERYRSAMRYVYSLPEEVTSPSNRLTVFVVRDDAQVRKLLGAGNRYVTGFYQSRAGGSVAFVPRVDDDSRSDRVSDGERILLHEYAHHFMFSVFAGSPPLWLSEGFAEFYASAKFERGGAVGLGLPADHRVAELVLAQAVPLDLLLNTRKYRENASQRYDSFYGRSWLLFHYLTFSDARAGQLADYLQRIDAGEGEEAAATHAFGDLDVLNKELNRYMKLPKMTYLQLGPERIKSADIDIRTLSPSEAAILPVMMQSRRGVTSEQARLVVEEARKIAASHPGDAFVQTALAEAEFDAGNTAEALTAADRALAQEPGAMNAHIQKIYALFRQAEQGDARLWPQVRTAIAAANRVENDNPLPLSFFYRSYAAEGKKPPEIAVQGLHRALTLAPYDTALRMTLAHHHIRAGDTAAARKTLGPLLNHPHDTRLADVARRMLEGDPPPGAQVDANDAAS
jgi:tetratricopeptide (TPR) repeat protein